MFLVVLAVVASNKLLPPNNARHKFTPNPTGACVVVFGLAVVLDLAVMTTGGLVVVIGVVDRVDAIVLASMYFFVFDVRSLVLEYGNKSIIIGSED